MKKRMRKKKHVGEFTVWGRQIIIYRNCSDHFDKFLDAFIEEAVEANGCYCGGGGSKNMLDIVVELGLQEHCEERLQRIISWLQSRTDVESWQIGEKFDVWNDVYKDLKPEEHQAIEPGPLQN